MINKTLFHIGNSVLVPLKKIGDFTLFQLQLIPLFFKKLRIKEIIYQIYFIGFASLGVIVLTSFFTGLVEAVELYNGFHKFSMENFIGYTIFISIVKELGPVFATLMIISRVVSSYAAELGSMRVSEQIDAIEVMAIDSKHYLIIPRIIAMIISLPLLILIFDTVANIGAYIISTYALNINSYQYLEYIKQFANASDFLEGVYKGIIFAYLIASIGTYIGYNTKGGAKGVGESTTKAVVIASITTFVADYIISAFLTIF